MVKDRRSFSDTLHKLKIYVDNDTKSLDLKTDQVIATYSGEILAIELDPANRNDVKTHEEEDPDSVDKQERALAEDNLYLIDTKLVLYHLKIEKETAQTNSSQKLSDFSELEDAIEKHVRGTQFIRVSISKSCIGIQGMNYNYCTNYCWEFLITNKI